MKTSAKNPRVETTLLVANSALDKAFSEGYKITHMKLQKIIYLTHKKYLETTGKPLFNEFFEVWTWGLVLPSVYQAFKHYRSLDISELYTIDGATLIVAKRHIDFYEALNWV